MDDFSKFALSFLINGGVALLIVHLVYRPTQRDKDFVLMFLTFNTLAFLLASWFSDAEFSVGLGLSLFALFSILRYRTDPIPIREMTYLFVMLALPVINAVFMQEKVYTNLLIANLAVLGGLVLIERGWGLKKVGQKTIVYERVDLVKPEHYQALLADLRSRTGLDIIRCEIGKIDFLHDIAELKITYVEPQVEVVVVDSTDSAPDYRGLFSNVGRRKFGNNAPPATPEG